MQVLLIFSTNDQAHLMIPSGCFTLSFISPDLIWILPRGDLFDPARSTGYYLLVHSYLSLYPSTSMEVCTIVISSHLSLLHRQWQPCRRSEMLWNNPFNGIMPHFCTKRAVWRNAFRFQARGRNRGWDTNIGERETKTDGSLKDCDQIGLTWVAGGFCCSVTCHSVFH